MYYMQKGSILCWSFFKVLMVAEDGATKTRISGCSPCIRLEAFKKPEEEMNPRFLWRIHSNARKRDLSRYLIAPTTWGHFLFNVSTTGLMKIGKNAWQLSMPLKNYCTLTTIRLS